MGLHRKPQPVTGKFPTSVSTARSQQQTLANSCNYLLLQELSEKGTNPGADKRWRVQKQPKASQCHSPAYLPTPKIPIFAQIRAERAATAEGGSTFILLLVAPGMGVGEQCRETAGARGESLGSGKQGKAPAPAKARSRGIASAVPPNPACLRAQGLCHCCPTRNS